MTGVRFVLLTFAVLCVSAVVSAQDPTEPITNWTAPPYWTMPAGGQFREHLTATEVSPENQGVSTESASSTSPILPFTAITPCRLVDTRQSPDTPYLDNGGAGETRTYHFDTTIPYTSTGACSLIPTAAALSLSVQFQVTDHQASLIAYPDDVTRPLVANVLAYTTGLFYMNSAIVPTGADGGIKVFAQWGGQVVININGYYAPSNIVTTLNGLTGAVGVTGGTGITVTTGANTLTIAATGGSGGLLPTGTSGQTLRSDGSSWLANSFLYNSGTAIGINTTSPAQTLDVNGTMRMPMTAATGGVPSAGVLFLGSYPFIHDYAKPGSAGRNTFVGQSAGNFTMGGSNPWEGSSNTAVGWQALQADATGYENTASGYRTLEANTTGYDNTASGAYSLMANRTGYYNTASGAGSLAANTTGTANTGIGNQSLVSNATGSDNTASGYQSLYANTTANKNTAVGSGALYTQSYDPGTGPWNSWNTAVGYRALYNDQPTTSTNGYANTAVGGNSLFFNTTGKNNTASGVYSLYVNTTGSENVAIGASSLYDNTTGYTNVAIGRGSLSFNTTGSYNTAVGEGAGSNLTTGDYNIDIGNWGAAGEGNTIRIGDINQSRTFIVGIRGKTTGNADAVAVLIDSAGQLGTVSSSIRFKQDVANMGDASSRLLDLRPVTFRYKTQPDGSRHFGLIAEEVNEVMPELVVRDATGQVETVAYHELPAMLLNELEKQQARIAAQQVQITAQQTEIDSLKATATERDAKLAQLDAQQAALASQHVEIDSLKVTLAERDGKLAEVNARLAQLDALKAQVQALVARLQTQAAKTTSTQ